MSSGLIDRIRRDIGVRLSLWYAFVFSLSSGALFTVAYYLLSAAVGSKDREVLEARWKEAAAVYQNGNVAALEIWVKSQTPQVQKSLFVRLFNRFGAVVWVSFPEDWLAFDIPAGVSGFKGRVPFIRIP